MVILDYIPYLAVGVHLHLLLEVVGYLGDVFFVCFQVETLHHVVQVIHIAETLEHYRLLSLLDYVCDFIFMVE